MKSFGWSPRWWLVVNQSHFLIGRQTREEIELKLAKKAT